MHTFYDLWPQISRDSYNSVIKQADFSDIDNIVFSGMGGSGTIGDILSSVLSKSKIHVNTVKGYLLPKTVDSKTLVITISVSGNTVETLSALRSAKKIGCKSISFSSGGKMKNYCKKNNLEYREIPMLHSPRVSLPNYLYSILKVLDSTIPISYPGVMESISTLEILKNKISSSNLTEKNPSIKLARWIDKTPCIYYPFGLHAAAIRFKNSIQENAKLHCITEDVIEACHNGIESWEKKNKFKPILIVGNNDYIKTKERWKILKKYFKKNEIDYREVNSVQGDILSKLVGLIYFLDYTSIYLAVLSKTDPSPIKSIDYIKKMLK